MNTFSQIVEGYQLHAEARQLSRRTLEDYNHTFRIFQETLGEDPPFSSISKTHIEKFLAGRKVGKKTLLNYHTGLSALWKWACDEGLAAANIVRQVEPPNPGRRSIDPFTEEDLRAMLAAIGKSQDYRNKGTLTHNSLLNADRNRAIILLLLDTGLRAEELCGIKVQDCDLKNRSLRITGKGDHQRIIPFCPRTGQALWKQLADRPGALPSEPLFLTLNNTALDRHRLFKQLRSIGKRAGVKDAHPHRFRHTFAINYLRNGGDPYTLQMILGHSTMEMVKRYLKIAQADLHAMHRLASPVANMRL